MTQTLIIEFKREYPELEGKLSKIMLGCIKLFGRNLFTILRKKSIKYFKNPKDGLSGHVEETEKGFIIYMQGPTDILEREHKQMQEFLESEVKTATHQNRTLKKALNKLKDKVLGNTTNILTTLGIQIIYRWV